MKTWLCDLVLLGEQIEGRGAASHPDSRFQAGLHFLSDLLHAVLEHVDRTAVRSAFSQLR